MYHQDAWYVRVVCAKALLFRRSARSQRLPPGDKNNGTANFNRKPKKKKKAAAKKEEEEDVGY